VALALNDIWFGGQTMNPWLLEEGSSGSSAGPGAATAADWSHFHRAAKQRQHREPLHALRRYRPSATYGRVPRTGAMTLCWSLDKLGPMARGVEDTMLVLNAICRPTPVTSRVSHAPLPLMPEQRFAGLRVDTSFVDEGRPSDRRRSRCP